ncbi:MAG TPA: CoA-binding protein [Dehalococcoidia bacterium]|nr:CoA-binding protein [Dehalococcoidia bacterium]
MPPSNRADLVRQLESVFDPGSVAVIGASSVPGKWGFGVFSRLLLSRAERRLYPVNRQAGEVLGVKAYPDVGAIPGPVELAVIAVPPPAVPQVMQECARKGVKGVVIITAGFGETGDAGKKLENEVLAIARDAGIRFVGPNCMGHFSTATRLFTFGGSEAVHSGSIACVSQSGNFGGYMLDRGNEMGVGFSKFVSTGNEADLHFEDYVEYLAADEQTKVITGYVEGLREPRRFFSLAREVTRHKPIVLIKVGRTSEGAQAAWSHTAALSGEDAVYDAALRQCGVIRVDEVDEMFDVAIALIGQPRPKGRRVGILTGGGGFGVVATDACVKLGLEVPPLLPQTMETLNSRLPDRWSHANPVDMAGVNDISYFCMGTLLKAENVDAVLGVSCVGYPADVSVDSLALPDVEEIRRQVEFMVKGEEDLVDGLLERVRRHGKPLILAHSPAGDRAPALRKLKKNNVFVYPSPERAARVLSRLVQYGEYLAGA